MGFRVAVKRTRGVPHHVFLLEAATPALFLRLAVFVCLAIRVHSGGALCAATASPLPTAASATPRGGGSPRTALAAVDLAVKLPRHLLIRQAAFLRPFSLCGLYVLLLFLLTLVIVLSTAVFIVVLLVAALPFALHIVAVALRGADLLVHRADNFVKLILVLPHELGRERVVHLDELLADALGADGAQVDAGRAENLADKGLVAFDVGHAARESLVAVWGRGKGRRTRESGLRHEDDCEDWRESGLGQRIRLQNQRAAHVTDASTVTHEGHTLSDKPAHDGRTGSLAWQGGRA